jgi:bacillopeptidase F
MKQRAVVMGLAVLTAGWTGLVRAGEISPDLQAAINATPNGQTVSALVYLAEQVDIPALVDSFREPRALRVERHEITVLSLQAMAQTTQGDLLDYLAGRKDAGAVADYHAYWIVNAIRVDAQPSELEAIAAREDVGTVHLNYEIELIKPVNYEALPLPSTEPAGQGGGPDAPENGVMAVRAPEVWAMGYTGAGVLVSTLDTGIQKAHPALTSRYRGTNDPRYAGHPEWAYYNPEQSEFTGSHGTHTMGTVCGGPPGDEIGVAPGAQFIHAATIDRAGIQRTVDDSILAFQWLIDPDGNPATVWDVPDTNSNSWGLVTGHGYQPCDQTFWQYLDACEAASIVIIFSAGNESTSGLRRPGDRATDDYRTFAVAAIDAHFANWPLAGFSSQGPTLCTPNMTPAIKPDISAPGVQVRSSVPTNAYSNFDGTSMASPHINGVVALMREANPEITPEEVKQVIYDTAFDLGAPAEDNLYGWGMVDAVEAVNEALSLATLRFVLPNGLPSFIDPQGGTTIQVDVVAQNVTPAPNTGKLYYDVGNGYVTIPMVETSPNSYDAVFPMVPCGINMSYYFSVEDTTGVEYFNPARAPGTVYSASTIPGYREFFSDDFETNTGWTVVNQNLMTGAWVRAIPIAPTRVQEPPGDYDGSGRCFVTGNTASQDVDGGPTILTSPIIDLSDGSPYTVQFALWHASNEPAVDVMVIEVSNNGGNSWVTMETREGESTNPTWKVLEYLIADFVQPTAQMRFRFSIQDQPNNSVTEGGLDAFKIRVVDCGVTCEPCDANCDGVVDALDIEPFINILTNGGGCSPCAADADGNGVVDAFDIEPFINCLTGP